MLDSGAGNHVRAKFDAPGHDILPTRHLGFRNASGGSILAEGEVDLKFVDNQIGRTGQSRFVVGPVKRPLFSTGKICDKNHIALYSKKGAIIVDEAVARPIVAQLLPHAKLSFRRDADTNGLYVLDEKLEALFTRPVKK